MSASSSCSARFTLDFELANGSNFEPPASNPQMRLREAREENVTDLVETARSNGAVLVGKDHQSRYPASSASSGSVACFPGSAAHPGPVCRQG